MINSGNSVIVGRAMTDYSKSDEPRQTPIASLAPLPEAELSRALGVAIQAAPRSPSRHSFHPCKRDIG